MRAASLAMLAAGAILTFAVSARVPGINLQLAGLIIIVTGLAGLIASSGAGAWVRRRALTRGDVVSGDVAGCDVVSGDVAGCEPDDAAYPAYLLQDPAVLAAEVLNGARSGSARAAGQRGPGQRGPGQRGPRRSQQDDQGWQ